MTPRLRKVLLVGAPIVAVSTLMLGLRVGAGDPVKSATIFGAPPGQAGASPSGDATPVAWQILTYVEDMSVRETVAVKSLHATIRSAKGEAQWSGASNADGIAELTFRLPNLKAGDAVTIDLRAGEDPTPLAAGTIVWQTPTPWGRAREGRDETNLGERAAVRPSKRAGPLGIDLLVEGERLVVGFETTLWAHVSLAREGGAAREGPPLLDVSPEAGLRTLAEQAKVECLSPSGGWAAIPAIAEGHVAGIGLASRGPGPKSEWFGALPVAAGAFYIDTPRVLPPRTPIAVDIVAPNPRTVVYAEIDDTAGRVFAAALDVTADGAPLTANGAPPTADGAPPTADGAHHGAHAATAARRFAGPGARFEMPALAPGLHWIVVSGEPRGAERLAGAAIARPILVAEGTSGPDGIDPTRTCEVGPWLAKQPASGFPRWIALDGMAVRGATNRSRHRLGLFIGLVALLAAGVLEALLLVAASREARAALLLAELDGDENDDDARARVTARTPGGGLAVALLVALLGFALLATLVITKG